MAEYSKQYVEAYMPEWDWDFDIEEVFDSLEPGEFIAMICEGFGFHGLQKNLDGSKYFLYKDRSGKIEEVRYELANDDTYKYFL